MADTRKELLEHQFSDPDIRFGDKTTTRDTKGPVKNSPMDRFKSGMTPEELKEYERLRRKFRNPDMSPAEARELATQPMSARLPKIN
jgi:hypothetical protein